jgi:hypothetical protein
MPEEIEITDNVLRLVSSIAGVSAEELDFEAGLTEDLGFSRQSLVDLAFAINKDDFFKPLGVGLIPDDVADCITLAELVELVQVELSNEPPPSRRRGRNRFLK